MKKQMVIIIGVLLLSSALLGLVNGEMVSDNGKSLGNSNDISSSGGNSNGNGVSGHVGNAAVNGTSDMQIPPFSREKVSGVKIHSENHGQALKDIMINKKPRTLRKEEGGSAPTGVQSMPTRIPLLEHPNREIKKPNFHIYGGSVNVRAVSGAITTNTTWAGVVNVVGNVTVVSGVTLTIYPGTTILVGKNLGIYVEGTLYANGTAADPVVFTNNSATTPGFWDGIIINSTATNVVMNHVNVSYATYGTFLNFTTAQITNSSFWQDMYGVYVLWNSKDLSKTFAMNIYNNTAKNGSYGIVLDMASVSISSEPSLHVNVTLEDNHISYVSEAGILIYANVVGSKQALGEFSISIINNNISYISGGYGVYFMNYAESNATSNVSFQSNKNEFYDVSYGMYSYVNATGPIFSHAGLFANVSENSMKDVNWGMEFDTNPYSNGTVNAKYYIINNTFIYDEVSVTSYVYTVGELPYTSVSALVKVMGNEINGTQYGIYLSSLSNASSGVSEINSVYDIYNNDVMNVGYAGIGTYSNATVSGAADSYVNISANVSSNSVNSGGYGIVMEADVYEYQGSGVPYSNLDSYLWNDKVTGTTNYGVWIESYSHMKTHVGFSNVTGYLQYSNLSDNNYGLYLRGYNYNQLYKGAYLNMDIRHNTISSNKRSGIYADNVHISVRDNVIKENAEVGSSASQSLLHEDFSGTFPPSGWYTINDASNHWNQASSSNAGGTSPEADFNWYPTETVNDWLVSNSIDTSGYTSGTLSFKTYVDWYTSSFYLYVKTYDGSTWHTVWSKYITSNFGPTTITVPLTVADGFGSPSFKVAFEFSGNTWNINDWYIDDVDISVNVEHQWGVLMANSTRGFLENNIISSNYGYGVYTDSTSMANWIVTSYAEVDNDRVVINGNLTVNNAAIMNMYNVTATMWDVSDAGNMYVDNAPHTIITNNVTVSGTLYLNGTVWEIAGTYDGEYHIEVTSTGHMVIQNLSSTPSNITSASYITYQFWVDSGAHFEVYNSEIHHVGFGNWGDNFMHVGLWLATDNALLDNATLTENYVGAVIYKSAPVISYSKISSNTVSGIFAQASSAAIEQNNISHNGIDNLILNTTSDQIYGNYLGYAPGYDVLIMNGVSVVVQNNTIVHAGYSGIILEYGTESTHVVISNNNILYNSNVGIYKLGDGEYVMENNAVENNNYGVWVQSADHVAGGIAYNGEYKLLYFPFGFEQINGQNIRNSVMNNAISWFGSPSTVLVVNDAINSDVVTYYNDSLTAIGYGPSKRYYWDVATQGAPPASVLQSNGTVIWFTGNNELSPQCRVSISDFLRQGGNLMFSSPDSGYYAINDGWYSWYQQWLRGDYVGPTEEYNIVGNSGEIFSGIDLNIHPYSGDGMAYAYSETMEPYNGSYSVFEYVELKASNIVGNYVWKNSVLGMFVNNTNPVLDGNTIESNGNGVMWLAVNPNPVILNNNVSSNSKFGILIEGTKVRLDAYLSYNNTISYNGGNGLALSGVDVLLNLTGNRNTISHNDGNNLYIYADALANINLNNDMGYAGANGVYMYASQLNIYMWDSNISGNSQNALYGQSNELHGNITGLSAYYNGYSGVYLDTTENLSVNMWDNKIFYNGQTGVYMHSGLDLIVNQRNDRIGNNGASGSYSGEELFGEKFLNLTELYAYFISNNYKGLSVNSNGNATVTIDNSVFYNSGSDGMYLYGLEIVQLTSSDNEFSLNGGNGMYAEGDTYLTGTEAGDAAIGNGLNGVKMVNTYNFVVSNSNFESNTESGFYLNNGVATLLKSNTFTGGTPQQKYGIYIEFSYNVTIFYNTFKDNQNGIYVKNSNTIDILSNTFDSMATAAVYVTSTTNLSIRSNTMTSNYEGIELYSSEMVEVYNNTILYSSYRGIGIHDSNAVNIYGNVIQHNYLGLYAEISSFTFGNNTVTYNLGSANNQYTGGLWIENSKVVLYNNVVAYNIRYGIYSDDNSIVNWFVTTVATVHSNPVYMAGNITVESGATMNLLDISGKFPDGTPIGLYLWSTRNNQYGIYVESGARMVMENTYITSPSENSYVFDVYGSMTMDGSVVKYAYVVSLYSSNVLIKGSTITHGWLGGIAVYNSTPIIENTNIVSNTYYGVMLYNSRTSLSSNVISNNRVGILLNNTKGIDMQNIYIYQNNIGIKAIGGSTFEIVNSTISSVENDMYLIDGSSGFILNTKFNQHSAIIMDTSSIKVNWFMNVTVYNRKGNVVSGATVRVYDVNNHTIASGDTNAVGALSWVVVPEYVQTHSGKNYLTPTIVRAAWNSQTFSQAVLVTRSLNITIVVGDQNPTIKSVPVLQAVQGEEYRYVVIATDPDGDALTYSLVTAPAGMTISADGVITWLPTNADVGVHYVLVKVSDGHGGYTEQGFNITVENVNDPPNITSSPIRQAVQGEEYRYVVIATDPDGDALTYSLITAPAGMTISADGVITWTPGVKDKGNYTVTVLVSDGHGGYARQSFNITVEAVNHAPEILNVSVAPQQGDAGYYVFTVTYKDPDGDNASAVYVIVDGKQYEMHKVSGRDPSQGEVYILLVKMTPGAHYYSFEAVDSKGAYSSTSGYTLYVNSPPNYIWDYLLVALLIAIIVLIVIDIYLRRHKAPPERGISQENIEKKENVDLDADTSIDEMDVESAENFDELDL